MQLSKEDVILERSTFSTLPRFKEQSKCKYTYVYRFEAEVTEYLKSNEELWEKNSLPVLNMAFYLSNIKRLWQAINASYALYPL